MAKSEELTVSLRTDVGQVRDHNEDFIDAWHAEDPAVAQEVGRLFILADGAGGMHAGEVASAEAVKTTKAHFIANENEEDAGLRLYAAMCAANDTLRDLMLAQDMQGRMATTMVSLVINQDKVTLANVGDSRGYLWHSGTLRQVTRDHSLVAKLVEEGAITAEEAETHPRRNVILASLGSEGTPQIDLFEVNLVDGDQILLCSDGLTGHVKDDEIREMLTDYDPDTASQKLIDLANERGGKDNISVIIIQFGPKMSAAEAKAAAADAIAPTILTTRPAPTLETPLPTLAVRAPAPANLKALSAHERRQLWLFTGALCLVQTALIFLAWVWLTQTM